MLIHKMFLSPRRGSIFLSRT